MKIKDTRDQDIVVTRKKSLSKLVLIVAICFCLLCILLWQVAPAAGRWSQADKSIALERVRLATLTRGDFIRDISVLARVVAVVSPTV